MSAAALHDLLGGRRRVAAGLLVAVEGSAPLAPGALMLVDEDGAVEGSITGGCVEAALAQEALAILRETRPPKISTYGFSDELAGTVGLTCGGTVHVLVHELLPADARALLAFLRAAGAGRPAGLATLLDGARAGAKLALVDGDPTGSLGRGALLDRNVAQDLAGFLASGRTAVLEYGPDGSKLSAGLRVQLHGGAAAPRLVVVGAVAFSAALAPLAAALGYHVTIVDPRAAFARAPRYAAAAEVVVGWPAPAIAERALGPRDGVLVFTHDPKLDVPALLAALASDAGYVGALGSRRTTADREHRLLEAGASDEQLTRLHAPCGLDIGSATPEETAISVLAELIAARSGRSGLPLRETAQSIRGLH